MNSHSCTTNCQRCTLSYSSAHHSHISDNHRSTGNNHSRSHNRSVISFSSRSRSCPTRRHRKLFNTCKICGSISRCSWSHAHLLYRHRRHCSNCNTCRCDRILILQIISPPRRSENSLAILDLHSRLYLTRIETHNQIHSVSANYKYNIHSVAGQRKSITGTL